jgi:hypothetical protein
VGRVEHGSRPVDPLDTRRALAGRTPRVRVKSAGFDPVQRLVAPRFSHAAVIPRSFASTSAGGFPLVPWPPVEKQ